MNALQNKFMNNTFVNCSSYVKKDVNRWRKHQRWFMKYDAHINGLEICLESFSQTA